MIQVLKLQASLLFSKVFVLKNEISFAQALVFL